MYYWCLRKFVEYRTLLRYFTWKRLLSIYTKMPVSIWVIRLKKTNREHKTYLNTYDKPQIKIWTNNNNILSYIITYSRYAIPAFKVFKNIYSRGFVRVIFHFTKFLYIFQQNYISFGFCLKILFNKKEDSIEEECEGVLEGELSEWEKAQSRASADPTATFWQQFRNQWVMNLVLLWSKNFHWSFRLLIPKLVPSSKE